MAQVKTQTLSLGKHWNHFIESKLLQGRYASASEMVRDGLRLLEEREANSKLEALRSALIEGEDSGESTRPFGDIVNEAKAEFHAE